MAYRSCRICAIAALTVGFCIYQVYAAALDTDLLKLVLAGHKQNRDRLKSGTGHGRFTFQRQIDADKVANPATTLRHHSPALNREKSVGSFPMGGSEPM